MTANAAWNEFARNLASCISALEEDEFLLVARKTSNYYIQFAGLGWHGIRGEAVSNNFIESPEELLTEAQYSAMVRIGWNRATSLPSETLTKKNIHGSPNFFADADRGSDMNALAAISVKALRQVYGVPHPGMLTYEAFHTDGSCIRFPTLRIVRYRPVLVAELARNEARGASDDLTD